MFRPKTPPKPHRLTLLDLLTAVEMRHPLFALEPQKNVDVVADAASAPEMESATQSSLVEQPEMDFSSHLVPIDYSESATQGDKIDSSLQELPSIHEKRKARMPSSKHKSKAHKTEGPHIKYSEAINLAEEAQQDRASEKTNEAILILERHDLTNMNDYLIRDAFEMIAKLLTQPLTANMRKRLVVVTFNHAEAILELLIRSDLLLDRNSAAQCAQQLFEVYRQLVKQFSKYDLIVEIKKDIHYFEQQLSLKITPPKSKAEADALIDDLVAHKSKQLKQIMEIFTQPAQEIEMICPRM